MPSPAHSDVDGAVLFALVEAYAEIGDHRTGSSCDTRTAQWMAGQLESRGLVADTEPLAFDRWTATSRVACDDEDLPHLALPYAWTGTINTDHVHVAAFDPKSGGIAGVIEPHIESAKASGAHAAVLATTHPEGSLIAVNRPLETAASDFPTVLVAGRDLERLQGGSVTLDMTASVAPGASSNVVATNGKPGSPLVLTTPLNGWFGCAGERGTGIAVLLHLVEQFLDTPLVVVATGGHELGYFGGHRWVDACSFTPAAIVHVGASVAVEEGPADERRLASTRLAMTSVGEAEGASLVAALEPAMLRLSTATERWLGEGEAFCKLGAPLLSFTGAGLDFHTPEDTAERATSASALATVADAFTDATAALWRLSMETAP